ncbi:3-oxo-tetronate kinase [Fodinicola acaciae]|uniref:3-oxo-tetronate kinase n=1 Tax=Fodinicola acaciae TaxID=2681555 RepID=UPI0013D5C2A3|nr:3-oxo-tetronate kinase [Fodinicola acaciae]
MIGVIADDYTGATDAAVAYRRVGLRTLLFFGTPASTSDLPPHDVLVVALKSRMLPAAEATGLSLRALDWLRASGVDQVYFKFCSTFDSTPRGNIGPVLDTLAAALSARTVLLTPSSPEHRRTQYHGYLHVDGVLLAESHMRHHPLTPMTDSSLPRLLAAQTDENVALIDLTTVRKGAAAVQNALADQSGYVLADAIDDEDIRTLGRAVVSQPLIAGAAGLAGGLAEAYAQEHPPSPIDDDTFPTEGPTAVLSGSCSARTLEQLEVMAGLGRPAFRLDPLAQTDLAAGALDWYDALPAGDAPIIYSSAPPDQLRDIQRKIGADQAAAVLEEATGRIAVGLVERGVRRLVAAGGETSGAVVTALGIDGAALGPEAARGVPWLYPVSGRPAALLLKSGNFGGPDLLATASA